MKDYTKLYEQRKEAMKASKENNPAYEDAMLRKMSEDRLDEMYSKMEELTGVRPTEEFNYPKVQKLLGLLRRMSFRPSLWERFSEEFGISVDTIRSYRIYIGSPMFIANSTIFPESFPVDISKMAGYIKLAAEELDILVEDYQLSDFNEDFVNELYERSRLRVQRELETKAATAEADKVLEEGFDE